MPTDLTISIATWNNRELIADCLRSIHEQRFEGRIEIIVIDNASTDGTAAMIRSEFPEARLIENEAPRGFSANHNQALRLASGRFILLLNDDTIVLEGALQRSLQFMESHPDVGALGLTLLKPDGAPERVSQRFPHPLDPIFPRLRARTGPGADRGEPVAVERWSGAALMLRREAVEQVGALDERFDPAYGEDTDFCYRIRRAGWRIFRLPDARVIHYRGRTAKREIADQARRLQEAKFRWYRKHRSRSALWLYKAAVLVASIFEFMPNLPLFLSTRRRSEARARAGRLWSRLQAVFSRSDRRGL